MAYLTRSAQNELTGYTRAHTQKKNAHMHAHTNTHVHICAHAGDLQCTK